MKSKFFIMLFLFSVTVFSSIAYAGDLYINKIPAGAKVNTVEIDGFIFVSLRQVADIAGADIEWDGKAKTATVYNPFSAKKSVLAVIKTGDVKVTVYPLDAKGNSLERAETKLPSAPVIIDSRMYIPLDFIAESFGYSASYDKKTGNIYMEA